MSGLTGSGLTDIVLHNYWRSSASWRVRTALALKGFEYTYEPVHLVKDGGEQYGDAFTQKNPMSQLPLFEATLDDGRQVSIAQSIAIIEFLDEVSKAHPLLPKDVVLRAHCRQLSELINAGTQPLQNLSVIEHLRDDLGVDAKAFCRRFIKKGLLAYQASLFEHDGAFSLPLETPTMADMCLVPQLYNARRFEVELDEMERLCAIELNCFKLDAFKKSKPEAQPDAVV